MKYILLIIVCITQLGLAPPPLSQVVKYNPSLLKIVKREVRRKASPLMCFGCSVVLRKILENLGDKATLMGIYERTRFCDIPAHFFVYSKAYGPIDIYPEGYTNAPLERGETYVDERVEKYLSRLTAQVWVNVQLRLLEEFKIIEMYKKAA